MNKSCRYSLKLVNPGYINKRRYLGRTYARIFGYGRNLIQEVNNEFIGTDDVQGQISERIFAPNGGY